MGKQTSEYQTILDFVVARSDGDGDGGANCMSLKRGNAPLPAYQHSVFYRPVVLPAAQQTVSKQWRQRQIT